jgi:hypothetical protein
MATMKPPSAMATIAGSMKASVSKPVNGSLPPGGEPAGGEPAGGAAAGGLGEADGAGAGDLGWWLLVGIGLGVAVGGAATFTTLTTLALQVTVLPPPLADPLHWLILTLIAEVTVDVVTVHFTRLLPPPPLPDPLHWVMVAPLVEPSGLHWVVGCVPPPFPDPMHWLTVAGFNVASPVTLLTMRTLQPIVPPPPLADPLHWVTDVVRWLDAFVDVVQVGAACAAP